MTNAYFILSIDTEFHWGYNLYPNSKMFKIVKKNEKKMVKNIDILLEIFEKYKVPVTWAIVGELFHSNKNIIDNIISNSIKHEIGYHSFNHIVFPESNYQDAEYQFEKAIELENNFGIKFNSFVYPENKIGHVDILKKYGFKIYRGPNLAGKNIDKNLLTKSKNVIESKIIAPPVSPIWRDGIWEIPSSMLLFGTLFSSTLVMRTKYGIKKAINDNKIFHIFMHPEDLLIKQDLPNLLDEILKFVTTTKDVRVITMEDLSQILNRT